LIESILLAIALAMDATAVATGRAVVGLNRREAVVLAASFGLFQGGMAAIGWGLGASAMGIVERWGHWLVFGLLASLGGKMILEALRSRPDDGSPALLSIRTIVVLSVATSIDALAAGVTLPLLRAPVALSLVSIGLVTFALSLGGALGGAALGARFGRRLEVLGGLVLIGIGIKTLLEHRASPGG
jgi:manganese efflux pump family protein